MSRVKYKDGDEWKYLNVLTSAGEGGGGDTPVELPDELLHITGDCSYKFVGGAWDWIFDKYGDQIVCDNITDASYMFYFHPKSTLPLNPINLATGTLARNIFSTCNYLRENPIINGSVSTFYSMFNSCYSLKKANLPLCSWYANSNYNAYQYAFYYCCVLDEITDLPLFLGSSTNVNQFSNAFYHCSRLKRLTFETNADGSAKKVNWGNQVIDLTSNVGYTSSPSLITGYNSGLTATTMIGTTNYSSMKDNPNGWTTDYRYSRYNKTSAIETINSLPDTSTTGTNTIKFYGRAGISTDGKAINTMSADEIAVATAKGWTVSFV